MPPTISVLITYYNERELLTECLRSLLEQGPAQNRGDVAAAAHFGL